MRFAVLRSCETGLLLIQRKLGRTHCWASIVCCGIFLPMRHCTKRHPLFHWAHWSSNMQTVHQPIGGGKRKKAMATFASPVGFRRWLCTFSLCSVFGGDFFLAVFSVKGKGVLTPLSPKPLFHSLRVLKGAISSSQSWGVFPSTGAWSSRVAPCVPHIVPSIVGDFPALSLEGRCLATLFSQVSWVYSSWG